MIEVRKIPAADVSGILGELAQLRITVFREFPYLYEGDVAYERNYLSAYEGNEKAAIIGAFDEGRLVGAATGTPLADHHDEFADAFLGTGLDLSTIFYCAESVLLPYYRGLGIGHAFFDEREDHALDLGFTKSCFCAVVRGEDHPARPTAYSPLDQFWTKRGYRKLDGVTTRFGWKDIGEVEESSKLMQFWMKDL